MKNLPMLAASTVMATVLIQPSFAEEGVDNLSGDFRLRLETVDQDNAARDATAVTLRSRLTYSSDSYHGFSGLLELENNSALVDDYNDTVGGGSQYSVVADPEFTELDQAYIQYKTDRFSGKLGRQVITADSHRFIGHVGWRQDRQTFDAVNLRYQAAKSLSLSAAYISKRNRIFANEKDIKSKDWLLNAKHKTEYGQLSAYAYLLHQEVSGNDLNTFGARYQGKRKVADIPMHYRVELAQQRQQTAATHYKTDYWSVEAGASISAIKISVGIETLGSDNGAAGFATPLATLHKFNGWTDQFLQTPAEGLVDSYLTMSGKLAGGKWLLAYHDFEAEQATSGVDDLGSELGALYVRPLGGGVTAGIKYAAYQAGDIKVDTDKLWLWAGYSF